MKLFSDPHDHHKLFDAVIVGTGLTGGWAAKELTEAGLEVLLLDAGPLLPPAAAADLSYWTPKRRKEAAATSQPIQSRHPAWWKSNPQLFVDDQENPYRTDTDFVWIRGRQLGGRSLTWGGVALRFSDHEFLAPERDGFGPRWPISYKDLAPYYDKVERFLGVQGSMEGLDQLPDGIFLPPPDLTETERRFKTIVESRWPHRKVIHCRGIADDNHRGKWSPKTSLHGTLPAAFATGRATLRPDSIVSHLIADPDGASIKSVACIDRVTNQAFEVKGRTVILCASTIESVRIMLNSKDRNHPDGVGNSSGLLGRGLVDHMAVTVTGTVPRSEHSPRYPLGGANSFCIPRFRNIYEPSDAFIRGYGIWGGIQREHAGAQQGPKQSPWFLTAVLEVLPHDSNCVCLDPKQVDTWGIPTVRIHMEYQDNEHRMKIDALRAILEMTDSAGLYLIGTHIAAPGRYVHELGGARMGRDRESSVLDPWNRCWDTLNLLVLDGASFPSSGWQDPSLTMMAIAARSCRIMTEKRGRQ